MNNELKNVLALVGAIWCAFLIGKILPFNVNAWGVTPRTLGGLVGIPVMPFLHGSLSHLISNTVPLVVLLLLLSGSQARAWEVVVDVVLVGGLLLWLFGRSAVHVGASGLIFGLISFLIVSGVLERRLVSLAVAVLVGFLYGGSLLSGVIPKIGSHVSWDGHLAGAVAGAGVAWLLVKQMAKPASTVSLFAWPSALVGATLLGVAGVTSPVGAAPPSVSPFDAELLKDLPPPKSRTASSAKTPPAVKAPPAAQAPTAQQPVAPRKETQSETQPPSASPIKASTPQSKAPSASQPPRAEKPVVTPPAVVPSDSPRPAVGPDEGEDIQLGGPEEQLRRIAGQMQVVRRKLDARDTSSATIEIQDAVVRQLDELLSNFQRGGAAAGQKPSDKPPSAGSGDAAAGDTSAGGRRPGDNETSARGKPGDSKDSDKPAGEGPASAATGATRQQLFKQVWGQLPPQLREQMQSAMPEKFLPEYEKRIEEYYRRLAERP